METQGLAVSSLKVTVHNLTRLLHRQGEIAVLKRWEGLRDNIEGVVHNYGLVASEMSDDPRFSEEFKVVKQQAISRSTGSNLPSHSAVDIGQRVPRDKRRR